MDSKPHFVMLKDKVKETLTASKTLSEESKQNLLDVLAYQEGELQARDLTISALKSECLKHVLSNLHSSGDNRRFFHDPSSALIRDKVSSAGQKHEAELEYSMSADTNVKLASLQRISAKQKTALQKLTKYLQESEQQRKKVTEELTKLKSLDNRDKAACTNEKKTDTTPENSDSSENPLAKELESVKKSLKDEQQEKMQLVLLLVNDRKKIAALYLEEKRRSDQLALILREEKKKAQLMARELEEESKRSLSMEQEVEQCIRQLATQREESNGLLKDEGRKALELEEALRRSRQESEHLRKQLAEAHRVAMSQASVNLPPPPPTTSQTPALSQSSVLPGPSTSPNMAAYGSVTSAVGGGGGATFISSQDIYLPNSSGKTNSLGKVSSGGPKSHSHGKDEGKVDNSDNGFLMKTRTVRAAKTNSDSHHYIGGSNPGSNSSASSTSSPTPSSSASALAATVNNMALKKTFVGKGVPPPIPPNKPAIPIFKSGAVSNSGLSAFNLLKGGVGGGGGGGGGAGGGGSGNSDKNSNS